MGRQKDSAIESVFEETLLVLDVNIGAPELINAYVEIDGFSNGRSMGKNDLWIAATAVVTDATLVTTDGDFDHLKGSPIQLAKITSA